MNTEAALGGALLGMATANWNDRRQIKQQEKLQAMQIAGSKEMGKFNQSLALDTWEKTNYEAQRKQMQKAGLNVGLMYGQGGPGGTTQSGAAGNVTGAQAPVGGNEVVGMGMQLGMQMQMMESQIELNKSQALKNKADAAKTAGIDTEHVQNTIENLKQNTANAAIQGEILNYEKEINRIESEIKSTTQSDIIYQIQKQNDKLVGEAEQAMNAGRMSTEAYDATLKQINQATVEQQLRIGAIKAGIELTGAQKQAAEAGIKKIAADILMMEETKRKQWREWEQAEKERWIKEKLAGFTTSDAAQLKQWTDIITNIVNASKGIK